MSVFKNLVGQKFNMLTAVRFVETRNKNAYWECKCECGNSHIAAGSDLRRGNTKSCGCARKIMQSTSKFKDISGQKFGRLQVIKFTRMQGKGRSSYYECVCDCGNVKEIARQSLVRGHATSCGCYNREKQLGLPGEATFNNYLNTYKQSARKRGYVFELTEEQFKEVIGKDCAACGAKPKEISRKYKETTSTPIKVNGVDRKDNTLGYVWGNVQPMCTPCNMAKTNMGEKAFYEWIGRFKK